MQISSQTETVSQLFDLDDKVFFKVPPYQRNYSWKEEQIETLFNDIKDEDSGYYVGNFIVTADPSDRSENVIDGQQRLTTITLFLLAIRSKFNDFEKKVQDNELVKKIGKWDVLIDKLLISNSDADDDDIEFKKPRLVLLDKDNEIIEALVNDIVLSKPSDNKYGTYTLYKRFKYIKEKLLNEFELEDLQKLFSKNISKLNLLKITVPDLNDAYQVFISLNSKGVPLTPLDLMKGKYLSVNGSPKKWDELNEVFSEDSNNESKMMRFVLNNYDAFENKSSSSLTKGKMVESYNEIFDREKADYIDKLIQRAKIYNKIDGAEVSDNVDTVEKKLSNLARLDATTSYPLLLNLLTKQDEYDLQGKLGEIIDILITMFVRRNLVLTPKASNLRSLFNGIRKYITQNDLRGDELLHYLENEINKEMPKDEAFLRSLHEGMYDKNDKTTRFILISLEREFGPKREGGSYFHKGLPDTLDKYGDNKPIWTIEHIIPQGKNLPKYWSDILKREGKDYSEVQEENVHKIGNLTLTPYNSGLGQAEFRDKVDYYVDMTPVGLDIRLFLNESIDKDKDIFDVTDINKRTDLLANKVLEIFPITNYFN